MNPESSCREDKLQIIAANRHIPLPDETISAFCRKWNVQSFCLFGSIMRDDFRPDSDVDVLVTFFPDAGTSFTDLISMQDELEILFSRKVDLADRRSVEQGKNYIRRIGMLSGKPPVLRQMSYLLDMLLSARAIQEIVRNASPEIIDSDDMGYHALCFNVRQLALSAHRIDISTREKYPHLPWEFLAGICTEFKENFFEPDKQKIKIAAWEVAPRIMPLLVAIVPREDEI